MRLIKNFDVNPYSQLIWVSDQAQKTWKHIIDEISRMVYTLEIESVKAGHRPCAWRSVSTDSLPEFSEKLLKKNLHCLPILFTGQWQGFSHKTMPVKKGKPTNVYCIISREKKDGLIFKKAHLAGDHIKQGKLLGFPGCCTEFFQKYWTKGYIDPVYQMANPDKHHIYSNPILRYIGVRIGFHIPCSFNCEETIKIAEERLTLGNPETVKLLKALLSMPMAWDCYHGVAIIKTPIFQVVIQSNAAVKRFIINLPGKFIPEESEPGTIFPYTEVKKYG